ncbi:MAG TPA: hypothetical protein DEF36_12200 [Desulfotomaculum sp.]|nr:hypothetical protein [Desulfotomaculum sp.]
MKKINSTDLLFIILFVAWVSDLNFGELSILKYVGLGAVGLWFVMLIGKLAFRRKRWDER